MGSSESVTDALGIFDHLDDFGFTISKETIEEIKRRSFYQPHRISRPAIVPQTGRFEYKSNSAPAVMAYQEPQEQVTTGRKRHSSALRYQDAPRHVHTTTARTNESWHPSHMNIAARNATQEDRSRQIPTRPVTIRRNGAHSPATLQCNTTDSNSSHDRRPALQDPFQRTQRGRTSR